MSSLINSKVFTTLKFNINEKSLMFLSVIADLNLFNLVCLLFTIYAPVQCCFYCSTTVVLITGYHLLSHMVLIELAEKGDIICAYVICPFVA